MLIVAKAEAALAVLLAEEEGRKISPSQLAIGRSTRLSERWPEPHRAALLREMQPRNPGISCRGRA